MPCVYTTIGYNLLHIAVAVSTAWRIIMKQNKYLYNGCGEVVGINVGRLSIGELRKFRRYQRMIAAGINHSTDKWFNLIQLVVKFNKRIK